MAAYAAVVSLKHTLDQIERHPSPPISLDRQQLQSLIEKLNFLQEFLERYNSAVAGGDEADPLEIRIADAAYAAEGVIESFIVDNIQLAAANAQILQVEENRSIQFYRDAQRAIEEMEVVEKEAREMIRDEKEVVEKEVREKGAFKAHQLQMVGFDDVVFQLLDRLTGGHRNRQIIPITGMGGIGKTTLARHIFEHALVKHHFDILAWITISQTYNARETLRQVFCQVSGNSDRDLSENEELGEKLYKYLSCRRYLVILDDMWSIEVWEQMKFFFPDNNDGSRIIVTTRLSNLAAELTNSHNIGMRLLDDVNSWNLFSKTVFGDNVGFPLQFEEIGKKIVGKCNGLPLSIAVIGGLLAKSELKLEYWEHIEKNLSSIVNSENDEYCLRVLKLSYDHLPAYLKPSFLYMGMFEEDRRIQVSKLIKLWVSEGFLRPVINKSLKTIAKEYLKELVDRNLILVNELGLHGNIKYCRMHDLVRDLSLKEAQKQRFYFVLGRHSPRCINSQRHIVIPKMVLDQKAWDALESMSLARSFVCHDGRVPQLLDCRLLRTLTIHAYVDEYLLQDAFQLVNLRYLSVGFPGIFQILSSISLLWNLQTLIISSQKELIAPIEIWKMRQLKYVESSFPGMYLPDPPSGHNDVIVIMENLEALKGVIDFNLNEGVVKRIPNIKKLNIRYEDKLMNRVKCLSYLQYLSKLETLGCHVRYGSNEYLQSISFTHSLKKLYLECGNFNLEEILGEIGSLPLLQKLKLGYGRFATHSWEIFEGQFPCLKYLSLYDCDDMECWTLEGSCLPCLEELHLEGILSLEAFPSEIGEIPTLRLIECRHCSESIAMSLKKIVDEQEELQGEPPFHVRVTSYDVSQELQSLATPNFHVDVVFLNF